MTPTAPYRGAARRLCLLDQHEKQGRMLPWHPPGLVGWEILLTPRAQAALGALIPEDAAGRDLFLATPTDLLEHEGYRSRRPWPTTPLYVRATRRSLRLLSLCAPSEAQDLGQRVALLAHAGLQAVLTRECAPRALADLLAHYLAATPQAEALCDPNQPEDPCGQRMFMSWVGPWPRERLLHGRPQRLIGPASGAARLQTFRPGSPVTMVPVALLIDPPGLHEGLLAAGLSRPGLLSPLLGDTGYPLVPSRVSRLMACLLLPLRAESWRLHLLRLREDLSTMLRTPLGFFSVLHEDAVAMAQDLAAARPRLAEEAIPMHDPGTPALASPGSSTTKDDVRELCDRITEALEIRLPAAIA